MNIATTFAVPRFFPRLRAGALAITAVAASLSAGCAVNADSGDPASASDEALIVRSPIPVLPPGPSHYTALPSQRVKMSASAGNFCTLEGVHGGFTSVSSFARVTDDGTSWWLQASSAATANAVCVSTASFTNAPAPVTTSRAPYWVSSHFDEQGNPARNELNVWGADSACVYSGIEGDWTSIWNSRSDLPRDNTAYIEYNSAAKVQVAGVFTDSPYIKTDVNCMRFPGHTATHQNNYWLPWGSNGKSLALPSATSAVCGLSSISGNLDKPTDGAAVVQTGNGTQVLQLYGQIESAGATCIYFNQP